MEEGKQTKEFAVEESLSPLQSVNENDLNDPKTPPEMQKVDSNYPTHHKDENGSEKDSVMSSSESLNREEIETNDLEKIPPDFEDARLHGNASKVKNLDENGKDQSKLKDKKYF